MVAQQIDGSNLVEARQKVETLCRRYDAPLPQAVIGLLDRGISYIGPLASRLAD